jgi:hypothetical protein
MSATAGALSHPAEHRMAMWRVLAIALILVLALAGAFLAVNAFSDHAAGGGPGGSDEPAGVWPAVRPNQPVMVGDVPCHQCL